MTNHNVTTANRQITITLDASHHADWMTTFAEQVADVTRAELVRIVTTDGRELVSCETDWSLHA